MDRSVSSSRNTTETATAATTTYQFCRKPLMERSLLTRWNVGLYKWGYLIGIILDHPYQCARNAMQFPQHSNMTCIQHIPQFRPMKYPIHLLISFYTNTWKGHILGCLIYTVNWVIHHFTTKRTSYLIILWHHKYTCIDNCNMQPVDWIAQNMPWWETCTVNDDEWYCELDLRNNTNVIDNTLNNHHHHRLTNQIFVITIMKI